ncbi:aspartate-semialdehyde dehydrogenase [Pseudomonas sp. v388]|uniref:aspartate-semialdehyde dehydrogenase n=1 Tax=Pseudomonas sp. v388 TaxID=2479849 RepID=UPI000F768749|nr:aspartate-semialdehyde dehydrogenase [Pseudomonas sp. v388]RRV06848.1 aspartate-semialdehyde dehydrogenase [Pseudomonas sp. v388]
MLQPMLPLSLVPVTSQADPAKRVPDIPPVAPVQPGTNETTIDLRYEDAEHSALRLREEQQRQQQQHPSRQQADEPEVATVQGEYLNADQTVPVAALIDDEPRQGMWVDIQV